MTPEPPTATATATATVATLYANTALRPTTTTRVTAVRAWPLPAQPDGLPELPAPLAAAATAPAGPEWAEHRTRFAVEVIGDGISGWHAPISEPVWQIIRDDLATGLLGHDAALPRRLRYRPTTGRHRTGAHARRAVSAVELACWDLASRAAVSPVRDLLGGTIRTSVPAYASALGLDPMHPAAPEAAAWIADAGFWGQKWPLTKQLLRAGPAAAAQIFGRLRDAAGGGRLMVDGLGRCRVDEAMQLLPVLAKAGVAFAEELVPPGDWAWKRLHAHTAAVPLAGGEHADDEGEQFRLLATGQLDVWQVDPGWCGGLSQALLTTDLAAGLGLPTFPHGAHLPAALALAGACCRDAVPAVEWHLTVEPWRQHLYPTPVQPNGGLLPVRTGVGLADAPLAVGRPTDEVIAA